MKKELTEKEYQEIIDLLENNRSILAVYAQNFETINNAMGRVIGTLNILLNEVSKIKGTDLKKKIDDKKLN